MTADNASKLFEISQVGDLPADELTNLLKQSWGYDITEPFDVIGRLREKSSTNSRSFYILEDLHSVNDGSLLLYPIQDSDIWQAVFVGRVNNVGMNESSIEGAWVKARVELSPKAERDKHNNPFALSAVHGGIRILSDVPDDILDTEILIDGVSHVEQWVIDFYRQKHTEGISEEGEILRLKLEQEREEVVKQIESSQLALQQLRSQEEERITRLRQKIAELDEKLHENTNFLDELGEEVASRRQQHHEEIREFERQKKNLEQTLDMLKQFIEQKSKILLELDLIGQEEIDRLLGRESKRVKAAAHDYLDVFSADASKAVSYIQSYLHKKGIVYRRMVLEDFFALLTTHDLIILAGDSGSGKTNLVKSFAEAIGGKAVIVPVKPNWTSAEDLLGYYNPLEKKYLSTPFLDALFEARQNPGTPYFICLDEMNLARVEYYLADFLSLMEERDKSPEIPLYSNTEANHLISEVRNFIALIDEARSRLVKPDLVSFLDLLKDEELNAKLHELCGFREGDSLLKYHANLRRMISSYVNVPSALSLPANVRIVGAINVDETTHYLSPKVLDRAHIIRFGSPLLIDWDEAESELENFDLDFNLPVALPVTVLGERVGYPSFDREDPMVQTLTHISREFLDPLGIEFGFRTVRQARHYSAALRQLGANDELVLNNIVLHKILPKLMFDGEKPVEGNVARKDKLVGLREYLNRAMNGLDISEATFYCVDELDRVIRNAEANDWVVNYWSR